MNIENFNTPVNVNDLEEDKVYRLQHRHNGRVQYLAKLDRVPTSGYAGWLAPSGLRKLEGAYFLPTNYYNYFKEDPVTTCPKEGDKVRLTHKGTGDSLTVTVFRVNEANGNIAVKQAGSIFHNSYRLSEFDYEIIAPEKTPREKFDELPIGGMFKRYANGDAHIKVSENEYVNVWHVHDITTAYDSGYFEKVD